MRTAVISFTKKGRALSEKIRDVLSADDEIRLYTGQKKAGETEREYLDAHEICFLEKPLAEWAGEQFEQKNVLIFVGACGIAVRAIAGAVRDKLKDSPVLVVDECGQYVIPILSGHVGGANEIAERLASRLSATAVITTATDVNGKFAVDVFARDHALVILDRRGIAKISEKVLEEETVTVSVAPKFRGLLKELPEEVAQETYPPDGQTDLVISTEKEALAHAVLPLKPKEYVLGIGCKRGKTENEIAAFIRENLDALGITEEDVAGIFSIDRKKEEAGIVGWAAHQAVPYHTFSAEVLEQISGAFASSDFVKKTVGVDNVCERSALAGCESYGGGELILKKQARDGITLAVAKIWAAVG